MTTCTQQEIPEALREDARAWVRKLHSGEATQWDAQAFRRWRDSSPLHQAAFLEARQQWRLLQPALDRLVQADAWAANHHRQTLRRPPLLSRRSFLGAAGLATAAGAAGLAIHPPLGLWPAAGAWDADFRSAVGEQRAVALADEVNVTLNTLTSIRRVVSGGETVGLNLLTGEAAIEMPNAARAFTVVAGAGRSVAESARFEVRHLEGRVCVTCLDGWVRIEHPGGERLLQARQQAIYSAGSISGIAGIDAETVSAWRRGELVFKQAPLSDVIAEINRYRPGRVILAAAPVGEKTLSARFNVDRLDLALLQIQRSFNLSARRLPAGMLILS